MRQVTVYTTDKEYSHFLQLAKNLHYVKKIETDEDPSKKKSWTISKQEWRKNNFLKKENQKLPLLKIF